MATIDNWHDVVVFNLREASDDETVDVSAQELDTAQVTATKKRRRCDTSDGERSLPRVSALYDADDIE